MKPVYKMRRADLRKEMKEKERKKPKISLRQIFDKMNKTSSIASRKKKKKY